MRTDKEKGGTAKNPLEKIEGKPYGRREVSSTLSFTLED